MPEVRINYGVAKKEGRKVITHNDLMQIDVEFEPPGSKFEGSVTNESHHKVLAAIKEKHPGWSIMGYIPLKEEGI